MNAPTEVHAFLRRNSPFSHLLDEDRDWLATVLAPVTLAPGEILFHPGQRPEELVLVAEGGVRVEAVGEAVPDERRLIARIDSGECFPVEALHEIRPVFSTYRADGALTYYRMSSADFHALKERSSAFKHYCEHRANAFLGSSRRIFEAHFGRQAENSVTLDAPLSSLKLRLPEMCDPALPVIEVSARLAESGELAMIVADEARRPLGVFTLHDLIKRVLLIGADTALPVSQFMTRQLITLPSEANGYEAAQAMAEHGLRQILVVDQGLLVGAISERDLFAAQHLSLGQLSARIRRADSIDALAVLAGENWTQAKKLMEQGLAAEPLTRIISSLNDRLTDRVLDVCRRESDTALPDFCWIALGSEGRHEQTLSTDQDNGIIFADCENKESVREQLLAFAQRANNALAQCGVPLCKGGIMAGNPQWCLSLSEWKKRFASWIEQPGPEAILNSTIFFDLRPLYGHLELADQLSTWLVDALKDQRRFFMNLSAEALKRAPPLGLFRDFVVENKDGMPGTIDLKLSGVTLFVDAARVLGLRAGCKDSGTGLRLRQAAQAMRINASEAEAWVAAFHFLQMLRLRNQYELGQKGEKPHNRIDPYRLNDMDRKMLIESLKQAKRLQKHLEAIAGQ